MYDIIFLSYGEANADNNWENLKKRFPRAMRVDGIAGIISAHKTAASYCKTRYFWVVDADNIIQDDFNFNFRWDKHTDLDSVAVWRAINNVNGLVYGYGGVKLLPRKAVGMVSEYATDFTTSIGDNFHVMDGVASTTVINSTPFEAWKAGFRECTKLASGIIKNSNYDDNLIRIETWMTEGESELNGKYCIAGARSGIQFGNQYNNDPLELANINDWKWLSDRFDNQTSLEV
jgi:hypothetical protein